MVASMFQIVCDVSIPMRLGQSLKFKARRKRKEKPIECKTVQNVVKILRYRAFTTNTSYAYIVRAFALAKSAKIRLGW